MSEAELETYLKFAKSVAAEAGQIMQKYFRADQQIEIKKDESPVTIADKTINSMVIERVKAAFADHGVLGEEESYNSDSPNLWVCDPIDGTVAYTFHLPVAMFSLALVVNGEPVVAVAFNPFVNSLYTATKNGGSKLNDQLIHVSGRAWGEKAVIVRTSSGHFHHDPLNDSDRVNTISDTGNRIVQTYGCVFKACLIAEGSADGYIYTGPGAHDIAAVKLIIEEAGGKVTDIEGHEQPYNKSINGALLTNGHIHPDLLKLLAS